MEGDAKSHWNLQKIAYGLAVFTVLGSGLIWLVDTRYVTTAAHAEDLSQVRESYMMQIDLLREQNETLVRRVNYLICTDRGFNPCGCELQLPQDERVCGR